MKKILTTGLLTLLAAGVAQAQVPTIFGYSLEEAAGTYTALESPTVIFDGSTLAEGTDISAYMIHPDGVQTTDGTYSCIDLGFELNLAGETFTKFAVSGSGYLLLTNGDVDFLANMKANYMTYGQGYTVAGMACNRGMNSGLDTKIGYQVSGEGAEQCLTVEFAKIGIHTSFWDPATSYVDYQIKLYKDGRMQLVFNNFESMGESVNYQLVMGIRLNDHYVCANGTPGSLTLERDSRNIVNYTYETANGATVNFNGPVDCVKPATQPTELTMTAYSTIIEGGFTPCEDADTYLVVYATGDNTPAAPADQTSYAEGDLIGETTTVAYFGSDTGFKMTDIPGSTKYNFAVYAANAYGLNGPVYNLTEPLSGSIKTKPLGPQSAEFGASTLTSVSLTVQSNENDDNVVVVYTPICYRDSYGDHGLFGAIPADVKTGDVLALPESYDPESLYPDEAVAENGGVVAYVGKAGEEPIVISDLKSSTMYYVGVYTIDADGDVCVDYLSSGSREILITGFSTMLENPWDGNSTSFPRYQLPYGWQTAAEDSGNPYFRDELFYSRGALTRGTQAIQQRLTINKGDGVNGKEAWMILPPIDVNDRHVVVDFSYSLVEGLNRFTSQGYNAWLEGDMLEIQVSDDEGQTWTPLTTYTPENNPQQAIPEDLDQETATNTQYGYVNINADLNDYRGKTVLVKLYYKTFDAPAFGLNMYVDRVKLYQAEFPAVPDVKVNNITESSATVIWTSAQTDYQLQYGEVGGDSYTTVNVKGAMKYELTRLLVNTEYEVKVRGLLEDGESYSEWSDVVNFTTNDYPEVDAPENLQSDVETFASLGYVILSWDKVDEAEKYEVAYRLSASTEWIYVESEEASTMLTDLEDGQTYIWKVRAYCTHDRLTSYSAQAEFIAPTVLGIDSISVDGEAAEYYNLQGVRVNNPAAGELYIVRRGNKVSKEIVR